ncbi:hypothetical protein GCM10009808_23320 [Microbacterium sediminicola]|uniref:Potassium transporter Trk n=1 Tax=Microbacterium sediminicola TaxID=415210 RepID=A0ABP4UFJ1_9MICO
MAPESADHIEQVTVRRSPKYGVFLVLGAALGLVVAMVLTFLFNGTDQVSANTGLVYSQMQVFGFLLLICAPAGIALGGAVALIFDRYYSHRTHTVDADHARIHTAD